MTQQDTFDLAIIGGGPAGAAAAIEAALAGIRTVVIEQHSFPRFHVGESLTGEVGRFVRKWGLEDAVNAAKFPVKHGTHVYGDNSEFLIPVVGLTEERERVPTTTWSVERSVFDAILMDHAKALGAEVITGSAVGVLKDEHGTVEGVEVDTVDGARQIRSRQLIDASGSSRFCHRQGLGGELAHGNYGRQVAFFTHLSGVERGAAKPDDTRIFYAGDRHWAWLIPVSAEMTSIGIVVPSAYFKETGLDADQFVVQEMQRIHPELTARVANARPEMSVLAARNFSYQLHDFSGPGWVAVADAHRFVDPIFSLGVAVAVNEGSEAAKRTVEALQRDLSPAEAHRQLFQPFEAWSEAGQDVVQDLLDGFWGNPVGFGYLAHRKHHDDIVDIFSGRFYDIGEPTPGLKALRRLAKSAELVS